MKILYYLIYSNFFLVNSLDKDCRVILTFIFPPCITITTYPEWEHFSHPFQHHPTFLTTLWIKTGNVDGGNEVCILASFVLLYTVGYTMLGWSCYAKVPLTGQLKEQTLFLIVPEARVQDRGTSISGFRRESSCGRKFAREPFHIPFKGTHSLQ